MSEAGDIGQEALEHIINMAEVKNSIQAQNYFYINGQKTLVRISPTRISIQQNSSGASRIINQKKRTISVPFQNIVSMKCSHSNMKIKEKRHYSKSLKMNKFNLPMMKTGTKIFDNVSEPLSAKQFGFLGTMPDILTIHYVKEEKEKGLMKLKKVALSHEDSDVIEWWSTTINNMVSRIQKKPRHLLVFINPFGGKGRGKQLWEDKISEVFKISGIICKVIVTERANHALSLLQTMPLQGFDGVISVGGDGMFSEVFNGVLMRAALEAKLDHDNRETQFVKPDIMVGFIPGGSTDTVSMCLHGSTDPVTAALHIVLGDRLDVDVVSIHSEKKLERFAMTMLSYGYFGDLMKHSESLRWMGKLRYDVSGVKTFLAHKNYKGTISYTPTDTTKACLLTEKCGGGCPTCLAEDKLEVKRVATENKVDEEQNLFTSRSDIQPDAKVKQISGKFLAVTSATLTCSCRHTLPGMSPSAHTGDGATDLIIVKKTSHLNYFRYLFRTAFHTEHPFTLPFVEAVRVKEWNFQPKDKNDKHSTWNCDGEILENPQTFVRAHKQLVPVFARGVYNPKYEQSSGVLEEEEDFLDSIPDF